MQGARGREWGGGGGVGGGGIGHSHIWAIRGCDSQRTVFASESETGSTNQRSYLEQGILLAHSHYGTGLTLLSVQITLHMNAVPAVGSCCSLQFAIALIQEVFSPFCLEQGRAAVKFQGFEQQIPTINCWKWPHPGRASRVSVFVVLSLPIWSDHEEDHQKSITFVTASQQKFCLGYIHSTLR